VLKNKVNVLISTAVCQHQNIQRSTTLSLGKNSYNLGAEGSQEDLADITVLSTPQADERIEICLIFTEKSGITREFAEHLFDELCVTFTSFAENPDAMLPSPSELLAMKPQTLDAPVPIIDPSLSINLQGISRDELLLYNDVLTQAWRQILWDKQGRTATIDLDTSFYELGGELL
jgi:hypothetical protein